jgi:haloalkane dehalogenase
MNVLRTPDARFEAVSRLFPCAAHYVEIPFGDAPRVRVHYVDEGPRDAPPVLMLHGEPSWSFLYRKVIARVVGAGLRAVAPDLVGFGRSDKPGAREDYTYERHVAAVTAFLEAIDLRGATLLAQDWGGLIGLRLIAEQGPRFARAIAANTFLPTGDQKTPEAFFTWQKFSQSVPELPVGFIVRTGCVAPLSDEVIAAYDAPFPDESFKAGARQFPMLVPTSPDDPSSAPNRRAWESLERWTKPFHTAFSDSDPITKGADRMLRERIPGARDAAHVTIAGGGHFLQEDRGQELGDAVVRFVRG